MKSNIKIKLVELDIKQQNFAEKLGVTPQTLNAWVKGRAFPPLKTAFKIAKELECKVDDLWNEEDY